VDESNINEVNCNNYRFDKGEESVDCEGVCRGDCEVILNVTKHVTLRVDGGPVHMNLNITSPAINYPPQQTVLSTYFNQKPNYAGRSPEGNRYYAYDFSMPEYGVREFEITETVRLYRDRPPSKSNSTYFSDTYLGGNTNSPTTRDICQTAHDAESGSNSTEQTVLNIQKWLIDKINYEVNYDELGASYCYVNMRGACDEYADLFVSMARCDGIFARRVTGSLLNVTQLSGHAWAEYYDGGWVYLDPSIKNLDHAFAPDGKHIWACVGDGAYHCGIEYAYVYSKGKPKVEIKEQVYLS
jgi:transglutaminase-like putative cysteine protease